MAMYSSKPDCSISACAAHGSVYQRIAYHSSWLAAAYSNAKHMAVPLGAAAQAAAYTKATYLARLSGAAVPAMHSSV